jgi:uncharacterized membrane protein
MDWNNFIESVVRWAHVGAGSFWIGLVFFLAWVMPGFALSINAATKRDTLPELLSRALWWARQATGLTFVTGLVLLVLVFYRSKDMLFEGSALGDEGKMPAAAHGILTGVFLAALLYDFLAKRLLRDDRAMLVFGVVATTGFAFLMTGPGGMTFRGYTVHIGAMFGTIMAWNVWIRIWPAQRRILASIRAGETPDSARVLTAAVRLRHNAYLAIPLLFFMLAQHGTWAAGSVVGPSELNVAYMMLLGFAVVWLLFRKSRTAGSLDD